MSAQPGQRHLPANASRQRGQTLLLTLVALLLGFGAIFYTLVSPATIALENNRVTSAVLAQAKDAMIGYAVKDANRPGSLPCPDTNNDGSAEIFAGSACPSYVGRLPWRTLGLPDLRDAAGERLWYAVTPDFARNPSGAPILNSDTKGQLTITGTNPATNVIAIVFAAGGVVGTQVRDTANQNNVVNYLEGGNQDGDASYVTAAASATFNDRPIAVTAADIMTPVEKRVAVEILKLLQAYRASGANWCSCYPWADHSDGQANEGTLSGRVPLWDAATGSTPSWADLGITVPAWLTTNDWWFVFFYTVAEAQSAWHTGGSLTVNGVAGTNIVLITTGPAGAGRPVGGAWDEYAHWPLYVDDGQNSDLGTVFVTPNSTAYARDRLYKL